MGLSLLERRGVCVCIKGRSVCTRYLVEVEEYACSVVRSGDD